MAYGLLSPCSSSRAREIAEKILCSGPRVGHGAPLAVGRIVRARTLRVPAPRNRKRRSVHEQVCGSRRHEGPILFEREDVRQARNVNAGRVGKRAQSFFTSLGPGVVVNGDVESHVSHAVYCDAALEQVFTPGTLLRVAIHGAGVVGEIDGRGFGRHVELVLVVGTTSSLGAVSGFTVEILV